MKWPWDHSEADKHKEMVEERDQEVNTLVRKAQELEPDYLGDAIRRALSAPDRKEV